MFIERCFFQQGFDLRARLALAQAFAVFCDAKDGDRRQRRVQLELADVHFVKRIGRSVVVGQVVGLFLVRHQRRHALEQEVEIVRANERVGRVTV